MYRWLLLWGVAAVVLCRVPLQLNNTAERELAIAEMLPGKLPRSFLVGVR